MNTMYGAATLPWLRSHAWHQGGRTVPAANGCGIAPLEVLDDERNEYGPTHMQLPPPSPAHDC